MPLATVLCSSLTIYHLTICWYEFHKFAYHRKTAINWSTANKNGDVKGLVDAFIVFLYFTRQEHGRETMIYGWTWMAKSVCVTVWKASVPHPTCCQTKIIIRQSIYTFKTMNGEYSTNNRLCPVKNKSCCSSPIVMRPATTLYDTIDCTVCMSPKKLKLIILLFDHVCIEYVWMGVFMCIMLYNWRQYYRIRAVLLLCNIKPSNWLAQGRYNEKIQDRC